MNRTAQCITLAFLLASSGLILSIRPSYASSKTIIVPDDYSTIPQAVNAASSGDTVFVRSSTYHVNGPPPNDGIIIIQKELTLTGENSQNTTILGGYGGTVIKILSNGVNVTNFTIGYAGNGYNDANIYLENASRCNISGNVLMGSRFGIWLHNSSNNAITENNITSNTTYGVWLDSSSNNSLLNNRLDKNFQGLRFDNASYNKLRNNNINSAESNIGISGSMLTDFINDVDTSNTVGGQPICYLVNRHHEVVRSDAGYVIVVNSTEMTIANLSIGGNQQGILLVQTQNSTITRSSIYGNEHGILFVLSSNNNNITQNTFIYNFQYALTFISSSNNSVYLNNFIYQTVYNSPDSVNIWDNGSYGNYWIFTKSIDDITAVNVTLGTLLNATELDSSGIWTKPYNIDANNTDHFPLVNQVPIPEYPSLTIMLIFMIATSLVAILYNRRKNQLAQTSHAHKSQARSYLAH